MGTRLLITLDYELFFGREVGSVHNCMIHPVDELAKLVDRFGAKLTLFVDAGYLDKLKRAASDNDDLQQDYAVISEQLQRLTKDGHDVQLHIHPHWEDTEYVDGGWRIDTSRYRLHDYTPGAVEEIVARYKKALTDIVGDSIFAYRAGGWCMQPFDFIGDALHNQGIWLDSTVYEEGMSPDDIRGFDFRGAPKKSLWRFESDPVKEVERGRFLEIPITACRVWPSFYWKMVFIKKFARGDFKPYGDGAAMVANVAYYRELLTKVTNTVTSIDGAKAGLLEKSYRSLLASGREPIFNVMGHPKAMSPYSLKKLEAFLQAHPEIEPVTFKDFKEMKP